MDTPPLLPLTPQETAAAVAQAQGILDGLKPRGAPEALTRETAPARIEQLRSDEKWVAKYLAGDPDARKQMDEAHKALTGEAPTDPATDPRFAEGVEHSFRQGDLDPTSDVGKDLLGMLSGKKVPRDVYRAVEAKRDALLRDSGFVQKYLGGDREAARQMTIVNTMLAAGAEEAT